jgi:hypothetical protein
LVKAICTIVIVAFLVTLVHLDYFHTRTDDVPPGVRAQVEAIFDDLRPPCTAHNDKDIAARIAALRRDPRAREFVYRKYPTLGLEEVLDHWRQGAIDNAVEAFEQWSVGSPWPVDENMRKPFEPIFGKIFRQYVFAKRGVQPPAPGWTMDDAESVAVAQGAVAVAWHRIECRKPESMTISLYLSETGPDRLRQLGDPVEIDVIGPPAFDSISLADASGALQPYLVVWTGQGTVGWDNLWLFEVTPRGLQPIPLDKRWRPLDLQALESGGADHLIAADIQWDCHRPLANYFLGDEIQRWNCASAPLRVRTIFSWRDGRAVEACRQFASYFTKLAADAEASVQNYTPAKDEEPSEWLFARYVQAAFAVFGALMQEGQTDQAVQRFAALMDHAPFDESDRIYGMRAAASLKDQVEQQRSALDRPCPMSGLTLKAD